MTREEAIEIFEQKGWWIAQKETLTSKQAEEIIKLNNAVNFALSALRHVSRERVDKVWRGEWMALDECSNEGVYCKRCKKKVYRIEYANEKMRSPFCPACGAAQTDEAVEMVMERLEALESDARGTI